MIVVPTKKVTRTAIQIAFDQGISLYDAYYVSPAKELKYTFIKADEKL